MTISLHIYPEIHRHIATALPAIEEVELFLPADPFDFVDRLIAAGGLDIDPAGNIAVPSAPRSRAVLRPRRAAGHITRQSHHERD